MSMNAFIALLADHDGGGHMGEWGIGWMWLWGSLMMIGFAVLIVWLVRAGRAPTEPATRDPADRAREILAERYAEGALSTEEYRERLSELR